MGLEQTVNNALRECHCSSLQEKRKGTKRKGAIQKATVCEYLYLILINKRPIQVSLF